MLATGSAHILTINAGSSSIKFALFKFEPALERVFDGAIDDIGGPYSRFSVSGAAADTLERTFAIPDCVTAVNVLVDWLTARLPPAALAAIGHRLVYSGPEFRTTQGVNAAMLAALHNAASSDPDHLPQEIHLIETLRRHYPDVAQIACFDSAFHAAMPTSAAMLPIPRRYFALGVKRYGFHGLSCAYLMRSLAAAAGPAAAGGKVVIAHLGGGSSVTAVEHGLSRDTSMGLTPAGGIMMGKRAGDLDPGLAWHLARSEQLSQSGFNRMVNHQSGLLGVSGISAQMRVLLERQATDSRAAEAVEMFCYQARKTICAMAGAVDGLDTLIFSGGVGEHAAEVRARICAGLRHLGVALDPAFNRDAAAVISTTASPVCVRVMHTDEQWMIAEETRQLLAGSSATGEPGARP